MDGSEIQKEFPYFNTVGKKTVYLDNSATTQKPQAVIDRLVQYYTSENANIHRSSYPLSLHAEELYEHARETVAEWIGAKETAEVIFTKGSTESINLVAYAVGEMWLSLGDNLVVTELEHSSNYFPWKHQCDSRGAQLRVAKAKTDGSLSTKEVISLIDKRTRLVAVTGMSNVTGFHPEINSIIHTAHKNGAYVLVDASQEAVHHKLSVQKTNCDFLCFSGHKIYAPLGIGVLYGKRHLLEELNPFLYGGDMVKKGSEDRIVYRKAPGKYEAGTQNIAGALGLETALNFLHSFGFAEIIEAETRLGHYLKKSLNEIPGLNNLGPDTDTTIQTFEIEGLGAYDIGAFLGNRGIAIRCGSHCAYPLMKRMGKESTCRISLACYNTHNDIDKLVDSIIVLRKFFANRTSSKADG